MCELDRLLIPERGMGPMVKCQVRVALEGFKKESRACHACQREEKEESASRHHGDPCSLPIPSFLQEYFTYIK